MLKSIRYWVLDQVTKHMRLMPRPPLKDTHKENWIYGDWFSMVLFSNKFHAVLGAPDGELKLNHLHKLRCQQGGEIIDGELLIHD